MLSRQDIRRRFRQHGLRMTPQRIAIYSALVGTASHPTAEQLLVVVRRGMPKISANTVYYTLGALRDAGLVQEVNDGHHRARFDGNVEPHHHVICQHCRRIFDFSDGALDRLGLAGAIPGDFTMTGHRVEVYGYCADCRGPHTPHREGRGARSSSPRQARR